MKNFRRMMLLLVILCGCHKRTPATALPVPIPAAPPTPPAIEEELPPRPSMPQPDAPATPSVPVPNPLAQADDAFDAGNYPEAARRYDRYLQAEPTGDRRDEALFRLALSLALPSNGNSDWTRITSVLKDLVDHYPQSPFRPPAAVILAMESDVQKRDQRIKQLSSELDKLKQIDAERRKRPL